MYDVYNTKKTVDDFAVALERVFNPRKKVRLQGLMELINYMPTEIIELVSRRIWMTDVYGCKFFNSFVQGEINNNMMKRVIVTGTTGSSWHLKRFERVTFIATDINKKSIVF